MSLPRETRETSQTREDRERETKETWETFETLESGPESGEFATFPDHHEHGREHGDGTRWAATGSARAARAPRGSWCRQGSSFKGDGQP